MKTRVVGYLAVLALIVVTFFGSNAAYVGVGVAHASTKTPGYLVAGASITGLRAYVSTGRNFTINSSPSRDIFTGQSMRPPNSACLELAMAHHRGAGGMQNAIGFSKWCGTAGYTYYQQMDATWAGKYARVMTFSNWDWTNPATYSDEVFWTKIQKTQASPACWSAYLYNFTTSAWDVVGSPSSVCGTSTNTQGWVLFDLYDYDVSPYPLCSHLSTYDVFETRQIEKSITINGSFAGVAAGDLTDTGYATQQCHQVPFWGFHESVSPYYGIILCADAYNQACD